MTTNGKVDTKSWYLHTTEHYSARKRNAMLIHIMMWLYLYNVILQGKKPKPNRHTLDEVYYRGGESQKQKKSHIVWRLLYAISRTGKSIEMESRLLVARGLEREMGGRVTAYWVKVSSSVNKNFLSFWWEGNGTISLVLNCYGQGLHTLLTPRVST